MKTAKLVTGILSIILALLVLFQSCAAGLANTMTENGEVGGSAGLLVAICLLVAGIVAVATRSGSKGGSIAAAIFYFIGALMGFSGAGSYADLNIWAAVCAVFGIVHIVSIFSARKE